MESQRSIERKYEKLQNDVATKDFYKLDLTNRVNCYVCPSCAHITKTKDIDPGVTPMFFTCENCGCPNASSSFFKDIAPGQEPTFEWYRPDLKEVMKKRDNSGLLDHIFKGGLCQRKIKTD